MAVVYLPDGSVHYLENVDADRPKAENDLREIVQEYLGNDCAQVYDGVMEDYNSEQKDWDAAMRQHDLDIEHWQNIARDAAEAMERLFAYVRDAKRIDRKWLGNELASARNEIWKNL